MVIPKGQGGEGPRKAFENYPEKSRGLRQRSRDRETSADPRGGRQLGGDFSNHLKDKMIEEDRRIKWYLKPFSVLLLLFFVLGPFGLPLLYRSPKFSKGVKIALTIVVMIYTTYLIFATLKIAKEIYISVEELQKALKY